MMSRNFLGLAGGGGCKEVLRHEVEMRRFLKMNPMRTRDLVAGRSSTDGC